MRHVLEHVVYDWFLAEGQRVQTHSPLYDKATKRIAVRAWAERVEFQDGVRSRRDGAAQDYLGTGVEHRHLLLWWEDPRNTHLLRYIRADLPQEHGQLRSAVIDQQLVNEDSVKHSNVQEWRCVPSAFGDIWTCRLMHSAEDSINDRWVQAYIAPMAQAHLGHQHLLKHFF